MNKILFIDDELNILSSIKRIFRKEPYQLFTANSGEEAMTILQLHPDIAVVVSDFRMPTMSGSELLEKVSASYPHTVRMILSGYADKENIIETINKGHIYKFLAKPWDDEVLKKEVQQAFLVYQNQNNNNSLDFFLNETSNGVIITDDQHNLKQVNKCFEDMISQACDDKIGKNVFTDLLLLGPKSLLQQIDEKLKDNIAWTGDGCLNRNDGTISVSIHVKKLKNDGHFKSSYMYQLINVTKQKDIEAEIEQRYHVDKVTGLHNKNAFIDRCELLLESSTPQIAHFLYINWCRYQDVTETLNSNQMDNLLCHFTGQIKQLLADNHHHNLYYLGRGRFVILVIHDAADYVSKLAEDLCHIFETPYTQGTLRIPLNVNVAQSSFPKDGQTIQDILSNCVKTIAYLDNLGFNSYQAYDAQIHDKAVTISQETLSFESELYEALLKEEFDVFYQAFVDFSTNKIIGCEALIRWHHPRFGLISPDHFIPLLEKTKLIYQVNKWLLAKVFNQINVWQHAGYPTIKVSVNLSASQFMQPHFYEDLLDILGKSGASASCVELEITESMLMENIADNKSMLEKLRNLGFHLALDDFGTGYSSFSMLKTLPFNIIKIDRSFVKDVTEQQNAASLLSSMIAMGQSLGMHVIAEGIETLEQMDLLKNLRCNYGQGYYFSKPVPANEFFNLMEKSYIAQLST